MLANLVYPIPYNIDTLASSTFHNALYYSVSRPSWLLGQSLVIAGLSSGQYPMLKEYLGSRPYQALAKIMPISCLIWPLTTQLIVCSDSQPQGITVTFLSSIYFAVGTIAMIISYSLFVSLFIEFPVLRLISLLWSRVKLNIRAENASEA